MKFTASPQSTGGNNSKIYMTLKDGESVRAILRGDPSEFYIRWANGKSTPSSAGQEGAKFRFKINAIIKENGAYVAKIFEQGGMLYQALKDLAIEYDLEKTVLKISRVGTGLDTTYTVLPLPGGVDAATDSMIRKIKLHDLSGKPSDLGNHKEFMAQKDPGWDAAPIIDDLSEELPF